VAGRELRGEILEHANVFALDLHRALVEQLPEALSVLGPAPLTPANLAVLGDERGVYQLFERGQPVYVGKSDETLAARLEQHRRRCSGRLNISVEEMTFRCLYVDAFVDAAAPERQLIESYQRSGLAPWNYAEGFAPKDVGRNRDDGEPGQWYRDRPVAYEAEILLPEAGTRVTLLNALESLKAAVPFDLFRFASSRSRRRQDNADAGRDYRGRYVDIPREPVPVLEHMRRVVERLPPGWQATVLPQGLILYKEIREYGYALAGWRSSVTGLEGVRRGRDVR
jgi:hypothetical protein